MKVLKRTKWTNGYTCSCCGQTSEGSEWIDKGDMMNTADLLRRLHAELRDYDKGDCYYYYLAYENAGRPMLGFQFSNFGNVEIIFRDKTFAISRDLILNENDKVYPKEDFVKRVQQKYWELREVEEKPKAAKRNSKVII